MNIRQLSAWGLLTSFHPAPWYIDQNNKDGVMVKDNRGDIVYYEDFGCIPDEFTSSMREQIVGGAKTLANWLVAYSENPHAN